MTLKVLISGAFSSVLKQLAPDYDQATGTKIASELGASMGDSPSSIPHRMARDEHTDVLIMVGDDLQKLIDAGQVVAGSRADVARALIAAAVQIGQPTPDIRTVAELKAALLASRSIGYSESASGTYVKNELFKRLGIEDEVGDRARMVSGKAVGEVVAAGELDFGFQQMAELMPVEGISILGLLPKDLQSVTTIAAGISANSTRRDEAAAFIAFLAAPARKAVLKKNGLEPADYREE